MEKISIQIINDFNVTDDEYTKISWQNSLQTKIKYFSDFIVINDLYQNR